VDDALLSVAMPCRFYGIIFANLARMD